MSNHTQAPQTKRINRTVVAVAVILALGIAASIAAQSLNDQAVAVLAGAVCGVGASIPTSFAILTIARRCEQQREQQREQTGLPIPPSQPPTQPTIVVVPSEACYSDARGIK